jgi:multiphosphoryl transfer protein
VGDPYDPGVLKLVEAVCRTGVPVAVCGELAADDRATGLLVGLGVRELSVTPRAVPAIKQRVRGLDSGQAATLAAAAAEADGADAVRHLVD